MSCPIIVLRPEPGAARTAEKARALGLEPVVAPMFVVEPMSWSVPDPAQYDAVMITSANTLVHAGGALASFVHLRCFAVGEASAKAARDFGFRDVRTGPGDGERLAAMMEEEGVARAFHPGGADLTRIETRVAIDDVPVYASRPLGALSPAARDALEIGAMVLIHSARAGETFAGLCPIPRECVRILAISAKAARAAGPGWRDVATAPEPSDEAMLELARKLCQIESR